MKIKANLIIQAFLITMCFQISAFASTDKFKAENWQTEKNWQVKFKDWRVEFNDASHCQTPSKVYYFHSKTSNSDISGVTLHLCGKNYDDIKISLGLKGVSSSFEKSLPEFTNEIVSNNVGKVCCMKSFIDSTYKDKIPLFLKICHKHTVINDCILDQIKWLYRTPYFRVTKAKFIELVNTRFNINSDEQEFKKLALDELKLVKDSHGSKKITHLIMKDYVISHPLDMLKLLRQQNLEIIALRAKLAAMENAFVQEK